MKALKAVWFAAWQELPGSVHLHFSDKAHQTPLADVQKNLFPTAFAALDSRVRTYNQIKKNKAIDEETSAAIESAVDLARPTLEVTAINYATFIAYLGDDDLGLDNRKGALTLFAWERAVAQGVVDPADAGRLLDEAFPPALTLKTLRRALQDPAIVAEVEAELAGVVPLALEADDEMAVEASELARRVLSSPTLAAVNASDDPIEVTADEETAWQALQTHPGLPLVHRSVVALWLAHQLPVPLPGLKEEQHAPRPVEPGVRPDAPEVMPPPRALELSIVDRLHRALDTDRDNLVGVRARQALLTEVHRVVSPVGLTSPGSHAMFALLREMTLEIGRGRRNAEPPKGLAARPLPETLVGQVFAKSFAQMSAAKQATGPFARAAQGVLAALDEPTAVYAEELWGRVHGHEVRGQVDFADLAGAYRQLLGVKETVSRRLDKVAKGDYITPEGELPDGTTDTVETWIDLRSSDPARDDLKTAVLAALKTLQAAKGATFLEALRFIREADAEPDYREVWDRWNEACIHQPPLTYDLVITVLPLLRTELS